MENEEYKPQILKSEEIDHEVNLISAAMSYQSDSDISGIISIDDETSIEVSRINTDNPSTKDVLDKIEGDEKGIQLMDCNDNTQRKRRRWLPDEDAIILKERKDCVHGYALKAAAKLDGRNARSVLDRWHVVLKKKHDPNAPVRSHVKWTAEEDAIILHEREVDVNGYAGRAAKRLDGRNARSVHVRWNKYLKNVTLKDKHGATSRNSNTTLKTKTKKKKKKKKT